MPKVERDEKRESRIENEAIVDAYGGEEQALGWYYYLDGKRSLPLKKKSNKGQYSPKKRLYVSREKGENRVC